MKRYSKTVDVCFVFNFFNFHSGFFFHKKKKKKQKFILLSVVMNRPLTKPDESLNCSEIERVQKLFEVVHAKESD